MARTNSADQRQRRPQPLPLLCHVSTNPSCHQTENESILFPLRCLAHPLLRIIMARKRFIQCSVHDRENIFWVVITLIRTVRVMFDSVMNEGKLGASPRLLRQWQVAAQPN